MILILLDNLKSGGGKVVGINYLQAASKYKDTLFILPDSEDYKEYIIKQKLQNRVLYYSSNIRRERLNFIKMNKLIKDNKITHVINFTNVPLIFDITPQFLFLHKAQFLINIFKTNIQFSMLYRIKTFIEQLYITLALRFSNIDAVIFQTKYMEDLFKSKYNTNISTYIVPSGYDFISERKEAPEKFSYFLVPTSNAPHKDLETFFKVAESLENTNVKFKITLKKEDINIKKSSFPNIEFLGNVNRIEFETLLDNSCGIFLSTVLESFCLPYIEALSRGRKVITSDLQFAREVCGEQGYYFQPHNYKAAKNTIMNFYCKKEWKNFPFNYKNVNIIKWEESFQKIYALTKN